MRHACCTALVLAVLTATPVFAAAERYELDPRHSFVSFSFPHMGLSTWRGKFGPTKGLVTLDRQAKTGTVEATIDTGTLTFAFDEMDTEARTEKWFHVEKYPTATYKGQIQFSGDTPKTVEGKLTLRGVTQPVTLSLTDFKCIEHPHYKKQVCGTDAEGTVQWSAFGMPKFGDDTVTLRIQAEAFAQE